MKSKQDEVLSESVGMDISKDKIDCCFSQYSKDRRVIIKASKTFLNSKEGFAEIVLWIKKWRTEGKALCIIMEATGVYYERVAYYLAEETDYKVCVLLPNKAKAYAQSLNIKTKNDKVDAKLLGQMGLERNLEDWKAPSRSAQIIKSLCRERDALKNDNTMIVNQLHAVNHSEVSDKKTVLRMKKRITLLEKQINEIEKQIQTCIKSDEILLLSVERLSSIPGVGWLTAIIILAETDNFALFKNKAQLVSYVGLDVIENQSGSSVKGKTRISKKGNSHIRKALYWPAISHINCKSIYYDFFKSIAERTAINMKGYVAVQRKLLVLMYSLHKNRTFFDPNFAQKSAEQKKCIAVGSL